MRTQLRCTGCDRHRQQAHNRVCAVPVALHPQRQLRVLTAADRVMLRAVRQRSMQEVREAGQHRQALVLCKDRRDAQRRGCLVLQPANMPHLDLPGTTGLEVDAGQVPARCMHTTVASEDVLQYAVSVLP